MGSNKSAVFRASLLAFFLFSITKAQFGTPKFFNVMNYGAIPYAKTDNSQAFLKAWKDACEWKGKARVFIPKGTYQLESVIFLGPCKGPIAFLIKGILMAPNDMSKISTQTWISFRYVDQLTVSGGGSLDGQGAVAWPLNECRKNPNCLSLPITLRFDFVTNSIIHNLHSINSKNTHFTLFECDKINITKVRISAPGDSPNTDGIKIGSSRHITITNSMIGTGDDCVSILSGSREIHISNVFCGPGHGISIGSLGKYSNEGDVSEITVKNCSFKETTDGVRIKSWADSSSSLNAYNIMFNDIYMENVENPIIIDQQYCPNPPCNDKTSSKVQISNVTYRNIWGSSSSYIAETLRCSKSNPCRNIMLYDINLNSYANAGKLLSSCSYVNGFSFGRQNPTPCV